MKPDGLHTALQHANVTIHARNLLLGADAGATAVAAIVAEDLPTIYWAGDSRAYWIGGNGNRQLTRDHSPFQQMVMPV